MAKRVPADLDRATIAGYWVGLAGLVIGMVGFGFTIYLAFKKPESILFVASGWVAAVLVGVVSERVGSRLIATIASMRREMSDQANSHKNEVRKLHDEIAALNFEIASARERVEQSIVVSHFIAAKAVRTPPKPRAKPADARQDEGEQ